MKLKTYAILLGVIFVFLPFFVFAQETLTITTYYPSPYGSYNQLSVASNTYLAYSSGSVGIGTTGPQNLLNLKSTNGSSALQFNISSYPTTYGTRMFTNDCYNGACGGVDLALEVQSGGTWYQSVSFGHGQDNNHPSIRSWYGAQFAVTSGNVGIGTTGPDAMLTLGANAGSHGYIRFRGPTVAEGNIYHDATYGLHMDTSGNSLPIRIDGSSLVLGMNGNVGIGTASPNASLEIGGNPSSAIRTAYLNISANNGGITDRPYIRGLTDHIVIVPGGTSNAGTKTTYLTYPEGSGSFQTRIQETLFINTSNNVSVGTASTSYKFQVYIDASNEGHVDTIGGWARSSDIRFKKNVSDLKDGLARVLKLRPVRYDSKTESNSPKNRGRHTGFIGQEFEKVIPELVSTDGKGYKAIAYGDLTPFLAEAIQEQQKQIEDLKVEIQKLKTKLSAK